MVMVSNKFLELHSSLQTVLVHLVRWVEEMATICYEGVSHADFDFSF